MNKLLFIFLCSCLKTFEQIKTEEKKKEEVFLEKDFFQEEIRTLKKELQKQQEEIVELKKNYKDFNEWKEKQGLLIKEVSLEEEALIFFEKKKYKEAITLYSKMFLETPLKERALFYLSLCFFHLKDQKKLEETLKEISKINQKSPYLVLKKKK